MGRRPGHRHRGAQLRTVRALGDADRSRLTDVLTQSWGSTRMVTRGRLVEVSTVPGFVAELEGEWLGYVGYQVEGPAMEVVILEALAPRQGVASALLAATLQVASDRDVHRLWLITSNDNIDALRFYQRRGFVMVALYRDAITAARETVKPEIGAIGAHGIPIRDEIELELPHAIWPDFIARYAWPQS